MYFTLFTILMAKPIGILGGTFDPVHNGHIRLAIECYERLGLEEVRLVPLHTPPHRREPTASPEQRYTMLEMATEKMNGLIIDNCELIKDGISYTIETAQMMRKKFYGTSLCLLMGTDAFNHIYTWFQWQDLLNFVHIVIAERPGNVSQPDNAGVQDFLISHESGNLSDLYDFPSGKIFRIAMPLLDISSTRIREIFSAKKNPAMLLPEAIIEYIEANHIYS